MAVATFPSCLSNRSSILKTLWKHPSLLFMNSTSDPAAFSLARNVVVSKKYKDKSGCDASLTLFIKAAAFSGSWLTQSHCNPTFVRINKLFPISVISSVLLIPSDLSVTWSQHGALWWSSQLFSGLHVTKFHHGSLTRFSAVTADIKYFLKLKAGEMAGTTNCPHYRRMTN